MKRRNLIAGCLLLGLGAAGCSSTDNRTAMGMAAEQPPLLTLGAGDSLGWAVFSNDVVLASREPGALQHASVPDSD